MNAIGIALVWCIVQVSMLGLLAAALYLLLRRLRPAAAAPVVLTALTMTVLLSLMAFSPWPRWLQTSPLPLAGEGPGVRAAELASAGPLAGEGSGVRAVEAPHSARPLGEGSGARPGDAEAVPLDNHPSAAAILWQTFLAELAKPQPTAAEDAPYWPTVVAALLLAAMACGLAWLALGILAVRWQRRRSRPVLDVELRQLVDRLCAELGCRRPVEVRQADDLATAATIGWRRPVLLLPADWPTWTAEQRRAVLAHEIAHARSNDFLALLFGQLALVLHFYHPLLHWLMNRLRLEQELAADAAAAGVSGGPAQYLRAIAELALHQQDRPLLWPARSFLPTRTTFLRRIAMLRDSKCRFDRLSPFARLATVAVVLLGGLLVAGLRGPSAADPVSAEEPAAPAAENSAGRSSGDGPAAELARIRNMRNAHLQLTKERVKLQEAELELSHQLAFAVRDLHADDSIDTTFMIEDAWGMVVVRPAAIFRQPDMAGLANLLEQWGNLVPKGIPLAGIRQVSVMMLEAPIRSGLREVVVTQWRMPAAEKAIGQYAPGMRETGKAYKGKKVYFRSPGSRVLVVWDDRTVIEAGSEQAMDAYLAARRGVLPYWLPAKALAAFRDDHFLVTVDAAAMRRYAKNELAARMTPMTPVERAAFASVAPVWEDTTALAAGGRLEEGLAVHAWAATTGPDSSERVRRTAEALRTLAQSTVRNSHTTLQSSGDPDRKLLISLLDMLDRLLENVKSQQQDNEVRLATSVVLGQAKLSGLWSDIAATAQKNTLRRQSRNNLKGVALAMLNYHDTNKHFPPAVLYGPDGKTPYSWRVALLPYLEQLALYREYHFDEPWDGPHNRKLLDKMPAVFRSPDEPATSQNACYFVLAGPGTIFDGRVGTTFAQILDGTSNTILAVEAKRDIPWTKPEDIPYDPQKPLPKLGGYFADGFHVAMADGAVRFVPNTVDQKVLRALITKADRQPVSIEEVTAPRFRTTPPSRPGRPLAGLLPGGTYTASALLSVAMARKPDLASAAPEYFRDRFEIYKSTQQQLLLSRFVLEAALRNPKLAKLPSIERAVKRGDAVSWLRSQLEVSFPGKAELMEVSFSSEDPNEAATVVNVVVDTYLKEVVNSQQDRNRSRLQEIERAYAEKEAQLRTKREQLKKLMEPSSKTSSATEKLQAEIKELEIAAAATVKEKEKVRSDLRAVPRIMLLIPASVPQMPSSR